MTSGATSPTSPRKASPPSRTTSAAAAVHGMRTSPTRKVSPAVSTPVNGQLNNNNLKLQNNNVHRPSGSPPAWTLMNANSKCHLHKHSSTTDASGGSTNQNNNNNNSPSPFERVLWSLNHDPKWLQEITLGKRVGFYRFRGELGTGNFSHVKLAIHQLTREKVAIKILDKTKLDQKTQRMLTREIAAMETLNHPNLIRLFEVVETLSKIHLVMEYAGGGELFAKITNDGRMSEDTARPLYSQVIAAIHHMHSRNIIHRDVKAENVFFAGPSWVKVGDFGFSTTVLAPEQQLATFCGSPPYAAPELFRDESYVGVPVDMWASGVLLYFMVTGTMPFRAQTVASLKQQIIEGAFVVPAHLTPHCVELIRALLRPAPCDRPETNQVMQSCWLQNQKFPNAWQDVGVDVFMTEEPTCKVHDGDPDITPVKLMRPHLPNLRMDVADMAVAETLALGDSAQAVAEEVPADCETIARVKDALKDLGLTAPMLRDHIPRNSRSAVVGTFRIVAHRLRRRTSLEKDFEDIMMQQQQQQHPLGAANGHPPGVSRSSTKRRSRRGTISYNTTVGAPRRNLRSKACVIL